MVGKSRLNRSLPVQIDFFSHRSTSKPGVTKQIVGSVLAIVFCLVMIGIGVAELWKQRRFRHWVEAPCEIKRFEISTHLDQEPTFRPDLAFEYGWKGERFTTGSLWPAKEGDDNYEELAELRERFRAGVRSVCFVNPADPSEAALLRFDSSGGSGGWIPVAFGSFFLIIMVGVLANSNRTVILVVGLGFSTVGFGLLGGLTFPLVRDYFAMKEWQPVPAKVVWSRVVTGRSGKSDSSKPDVFYQYMAGGEKRFSNHFTLVPVSTNLTSGTRNTVKEYTAGKSIVCYMNPEKPWQAIVQRGLRWSCLFALFPVPFAVLGSYMVRYGLRKNLGAP